jgi:hypothetical protein
MEISLIEVTQFLKNVVMLDNLATFTVPLAIAMNLVFLEPALELFVVGKDKGAFALLHIAFEWAVVLIMLG